MNSIITKTDNKLQSIIEANIFVKRVAVFIGCLFLSSTDNITNIPLLMFMYHIYMIFNN